ncbi:hypothetical protein O0L34_g19172 [Tuta absoluta]|nr:hypothetical protein O0L34_g19172 [Tuta absoluta]
MKYLVLLVCVAATSASVYNLRYCPGSDVTICQINEIRIDPCEGGKTCKIKTGTDAKISFDFTPHFTTSSLTTAAVYQTETFAGMETDGCKCTKCPTVSGTQQTYNSILHIGKKLPKGKYEFKYSVTDATNSTNDCCFIAKVKLVR